MKTSTARITLSKATLFICLFTGIFECSAVRFRNFVVPKEVRAGADVTLECQVDLWPGPLYSLAWWKDGAQFYRVAVTRSYHQVREPFNSSSSNINFARIYSLPKTIIKAGRRLGEVILKDVEAVASGSYTCEAVADFPSFSQNFLSANLTVVEPPATRPIISRFKGRYHPGDILAPNCTVLRTYPIPVITWFVNDQQVKGRVLEVLANSDDTVTLVDRLTITVREHHFLKGILNLTCTARIGEDLWTSTSITAQRASAKSLHRPKSANHLLGNSVHPEKSWTKDKHEGIMGDEGSRPYQRLHSGGSITLPSLWSCVLSAFTVVKLRNR